MTLKSICLKKVYSSDNDDILRDFYIPALAASIEYNRLAGFFSSTSLAIAARGILGLVKNGGFMRLIVSPKLTKEDVEVILNSNEEPKRYIEKRMLQDLEELENQFVRDHVYALGWLIANGKLEIKVAIVYSREGHLQSFEDIKKNGLFHQKVGILKDSEGNVVTFSGSINESAIGWLDNIEEFKVFCSWDASQVEYVEADIQKFDRFWNGVSGRVRVLDLPDAVVKKLIEITPANFKEINLEKWSVCSKRVKKVKLFDHQKEAIESWWRNNKRGIFEMATGVGKTYAALGCVEKVLRTEKKLLVIITCPYHHLLEQWKKEISKFGLEFEKIIVADSSNSNWKKYLVDSIVDVFLGYKANVLVLTTHTTFSSKTFRQIIEKNKRNLCFCLIADEVHGLGAPMTRLGLIEGYDYRLGLSATPKRWIDSLGTDILYSFFGGIVYKFSLKEAISTINPVTGKTYLTPYRYIPKFASLTNKELEEYLEITRSIAAKFNNAFSNTVKDNLLERFIYKRANIVKNAQEKYVILEEILDELGPFLKWTLIYCNPQQIDTVMQILNQRRIVAHRFTMNEGYIPEAKYGGYSERDFILKNFAEGKYQVLVAMRCLDEGVDIPPAKTAILMANSGNPREYIQRIGRVLRRYPGKEQASVYDIIIKPSRNAPKELKDLEYRIFIKELERCEEIAKIAINNAEALCLIFSSTEK